MKIIPNVKFDIILNKQQKQRGEWKSCICTYVANVIVHKVTPVGITVRAKSWEY